MAGISVLTEAVAENCGLNRTKAREAVDVVLDEITARCSIGDRVAIQGFGIFRMKTRAARTSRNPRTGEPVQVPEKKVLTFKAS